MDEKLKQLEELMEAAHFSADDQGYIITFIGDNEKLIPLVAGMVKKGLDATQILSQLLSGAMNQAGFPKDKAGKIVKFLQINNNNQFFLLVGQMVVDGVNADLVFATLEVIKIEIEFSAFQNRAGKTQKAQHPKPNGIVEAEFQVRDDLPRDLAVGVFEPGKTYQALIRFSNANGTPVSDIYPGQQGMAIKLLDVKGKSLMKDNTDQDFLLVSYPFFFIKDGLELAEAMKAQFAGKKATEAFLEKHPMVAKLMQAQMGFWKNPLQIQFYSMTPYQFGDRKVKYTASPLISPDRGPYPKPQGQDYNYMREAMAATLEDSDIFFDFKVQFYKNEKETPIDNAQVTWDTDFTSLGTIKIPQQYFTAPGQMKISQEISYKPWNALPVHKPLGTLNLVRKYVYETLVAFRRKRDLLAPNAPGQNALNLVLKVRETPVTFRNPDGTLHTTSGIKENYQTLKAALMGGGTGLDSIKTIHFARNLFLDPVYEKGDFGQQVVSYYKTVTLITSYDEGFADYIIDFAEAIYERFNFLLSFVQETEDIQNEQGQVKVQKHMQNFVKFIMSHNVQEVAFYSSYPDLSVVQILQNRLSRDPSKTSCPMGYS